jgi:hypothetical protein
MKKTALILSAAVLLASGCAMTTQKTDPFAGLDVASQSDEVQTPLYPSVSLAIVMSENSKRSGQIAQRAQSLSMGQLSVSSFFDDPLNFLKRNFKSVLRHETLEAALTSGSDAVAVLDLSISLPMTIYGEYKNEVRVLFMGAEKNLLAEAKGSGVAVPSKDTPFSLIGATRFPQAMQVAHRRLYKQLYPSLREVKFLADLQAKRGMPAPAAPAVAAAPAAPAAPPAKTYRSEVEAPSFSLPEDASKFALVIGVENYQNAPAADHAARDARAVKAHLRGLGYPERNIVLLTDQQAGKSSLEKYLDAWLPKNTDEKSTVAFYFSGHGAPNPEDGQAYLMPWDGDPKFLENTGYPVKRLYERLNALKAKKVLVAMDACFSGAGGRSVIAKGTRPLVGKVDEGRSVAGRVAALTASAADETTGAAEEAGHGLFTYHLLKALGARGGRATFKQLYDELTPKVRDAARRDNRDQTPQLIGDGGAAL